MSTQRVLDFYAHDHDELDGFLKVFQSLKRSDPARAKQFFRQFKFGLQRHIFWEDEILFPVFESKTGMKDSGPTAVMRQEHVLIKGALEALHLKVREGDPDSDAEEKALIEILSGHNDKEENILYPAIDKLTTLEEREILFKQMKDVPEERFARCECK
jgi:iron-sulfur cluster repair protein YtfE (RIC family)